MGETGPEVKEPVGPLMEGHQDQSLIEFSSDICSCYIQIAHWAVSTEALEIIK